MTIEHIAAFIQTSPQVSMRRVGLPEERLSSHGLMCALDNRVVRGTALARKAHLHAKGKQPEM